MTDLVERLRSMAGWLAAPAGGGFDARSVTEAADEIERLRAEARDQRFVIEALNASVDRMERDLAWWRERERTRLAAATARPRQRGRR